MLQAYCSLLNLLSLLVASSNNNKCCCWSCCCCCCCCCCPTSAHFTLTEWALKVEIALCYLQLLSHFSFFVFFLEKKSTFFSVDVKRFKSIVDMTLSHLYFTLSSSQYKSFDFAYNDVHNWRHVFSGERDIKRKKGLLK